MPYVNSEENISFARKYRPNSLESYIGNTEIKETVKNYLRNGRPQSVLLTGNSGCGKTTMARLLVKEYLCENRDPEHGACCECMTCQSIDDYIRTGNTEMLPDIYEIDSSDRSGKKDIDAMLSTMEYPAIGGSWKVYIIDEVHLLSEGAMGRLLKSLEEPPEGVLLIFCTTNPEKLLDTIKNRCQLKLPVKKPSTKDIIELLRRVCLNEGKEYDIAGLRIIATRSENVVRDSLNNLERVLTTRGDATEANVSAEFKEVSDSLIFDFYKAYVKRDYFKYINVLYKIKMEYGFEQFLIALTNFTTRGIYILNGVEVEGLSEDEMMSYLKLFKSVTAENISFILSSLKQMHLGDIEANFMAFIYSNNAERAGRIEVSVKTEESSTATSEERRFRNDNLARIEQAKVSKGIVSVKGEMSKVGFEDLADMFQFEKVK